MSKYIHKSHNVTILLYHIVFPTKYRKVVIDQHVDTLIKETCLEIEKRYEIHFLEIGTDKDHIHLLIQSIPTYNVTKIVTIIKSLTARIIFKQHTEIKKQLWGGEFWSDGYFASTVGKYGSENMITNYVKQQGQEYTKLYNNHQFTLF